MCTIALSINYALAWNNRVGSFRQASQNTLQGPSPIYKLLRPEMWKLQKNCEIQLWRKVANTAFILANDHIIAQWGMVTFTERKAELNHMQINCLTTLIKDIWFHDFVQPVICAENPSYAHSPIASWTPSWLKKYCDYSLKLTVNILNVQWKGNVSKKKSLLWSTLKHSLFIGNETMPNPFLPQCGVFNFPKTFADLAQRILNSD